MRLYLFTGLYWPIYSVARGYSNHRHHSIESSPSFPWWMDFLINFGVPSTVSTDQGRQFKSTLWSELMELLGPQRICATAYHPSANGLIEWFHYQLKASLKTHRQPTHWADALSIVLLGIRTTLKQDINCSAAELIYGTILRLPGEFFDSDHSLSLINPAEYVTQIKATMAKLRAPLARKVSTK